MVSTVSVDDNEDKKDKPFDSVSEGNNSKKFSEALKHRHNTKEDLDKSPVEIEYSNLWNNRQIPKEAPKFLSAKEIKSLAQKHLPCESVCCSAASDLAALGILEEYREHMRQVRDQLK